MSRRGRVGREAERGAHLDAAHWVVLIDLESLKPLIFNNDVAHVEQS